MHMQAQQINQSNPRWMIQTPEAWEDPSNLGT